MTVEQITVLIAEDDEQMRRALCTVIEADSDLRLVASVADAEEAIDLTAVLEPDVALLDVNMPRGGGTRAAREIRRLPGRTQVLALSAADDRATVLAMVEAGAVGYLVKGGPIADIGAGIRRAAEGRSSLSPDVAGAVVDELASELQLRRRRQERMASGLARVRALIDEPHRVNILLQPLCSLEDQAPIGYEALARFDTTPQRTPDRWFREAAKVGYGPELELVALQRGVARLADLPPGTFLALNGSPDVFARPEVRRLFADHPAERLVLEITEHAPVRDYEALERRLRPLRASGARVAVDDAGAGFASLRHILRLAPDVIKLDRSLVSGIGRSVAQQAMAGGLISFAHRMGAVIVAEGIERTDELATLRELGVDYGQGFLLAHPAAEPFTA